LSYAHRTEIAKLLFEIGIKEIEAGIPAMRGEEIKFLSSLNELFPERRIIAWCRAIDADLQDAQRAGCRSVHIAFPVSDIQLKSMGKDSRWLFSTLERIIAVAIDKFEFVSVGAMDASRASAEILEHFCTAALFAGVGRIRIADTVGILTPRKTTILFEKLAMVIDVQKLEFHGHNDLGMATANALSAAEAGAGALSVTVNGLGERAGNTALEEMAMALRIAGIPAQRLQLAGIQELCERVSFYTNQPIPSSKPITGKAVFLHESGIHWNALLEDKRSFEPFSPSTTGHTASAPVAGSHCGGATILAIMANTSMRFSRHGSRKVAGIVRKRVQKFGRAMTAQEVEQVCKKHVHGAKR
jgi:homocitrate synthase NifV